MCASEDKQDNNLSETDAEEHYKLAAHSGVIMNNVVRVLAVASLSCTLE